MATRSSSMLAGSSRMLTDPTGDWSIKLKIYATSNLWYGPSRSQRRI